MTLFSSVEQAPADPILGITEKYNADQRPAKVNLGVGVYQNASGKLPLMRCVKLAEQKLAEDPRPRGYLPIDGLKSYTADVQALVFGKDSDVLAAGRVVTLEALGGTGALKLGADFLRQVNPGATVLISDPSWENHRQLFSRAGFEVSAYRYYDAENRGIDFAGMLADLRQAEPGTIVVLHACCHNPTGYDLKHDQWLQVLDVVEQRGLVPFLDMAYQGFSEGLDSDAWVARTFATRLGNLFCSSSFSKNFGLYGERVGALSIVCRDTDEAQRVRSQMKIVIRTNYSNPPTHGAQLVASVFADPALRAEWAAELTEMRERIKSMRVSLASHLAAEGLPEMGYVAEQVGMFSYSGLNRDQMLRLRDQFGVYGTDAGRICVAALNENNVEYVAKAIAAVVKG
ncbi:amino acid aminotransferase [Propionimicrobium sp. PCR01-08-3]|uniref:amino acid aminotransferase n=1 Tax=Propionimicrobium sp. PCR01-08-3 TaxID=3052086 RepID=UPI00255C8C94|nr:amino acid aminotransferase [Propionimicrobium sp. PCR01-08-3]WIY83158.1 amino acid aminotransferase [Propionimicrobium sp. PCR01-08-3]